MNSRSSSESRRLQLERLFKEYRNQRFPGSMGFKEIDMLHTLFIQYDVDVRGDIAKLLDAPKPSNNLLQLSGLQEDEKIQLEIDRLGSRYPPDSEVGRVTRRYSDYYDLIKRMLKAARSYTLTSRMNNVGP